MNIQQLINSLDGGETTRYHTVKVIEPESVAAHSFGVALICNYLTNNAPSANLLRAALFHDLAEQETGDIPAQVKWENKFLKTILEKLEDDFNIKNELFIELSEKEKFILKCADGLQCLWRCIQERRMGNQHIDIVAVRIKDNLYKRINKMELEYIFLTEREFNLLQTFSMMYKQAAKGTE